MINPNQNERVMIFIDLSNVIKNAEGFCGFEIYVDFKRIVETVLKGRKLVAAYMFDAHTSERDPCNQLYDAFRRQGFRVITRMYYEKDAGEQKEVDVAMACEMLSHAYKNNYDTAVVVSGDRDFRPAIEHIQAAGKRAEVAGISTGMSWKLSRSCDVFHDLDGLPIFCVIKPENEEPLDPAPHFVPDDILTLDLEDIA